LTVPPRAHGGLTTRETEVVSIKNQLIRAAAVGTVGVAAMAGFVGPASAGTTLTLSHSAVATAAAKPNSNIIGSGKTVNYSPKSLKVKWSGATQKTCTVKIESFTISNTTKTTETVTFSGKTFAKIPARKGIGVCVFGTGTATGAFGLAANKKAKLTVNVS
jgi:hypothetical protein